MRTCDQPIDSSIKSISRSIPGVCQYLDGVSEEALASPSELLAVDDVGDGVTDLISDRRGRLFAVTDIVFVVNTLVNLGGDLVPSLSSESLMGLIRPCFL